MIRRSRGRTRLRFGANARFEPLETRHCLSVAGLLGLNDLLFAVNPVVSNPAPALIGEAQTGPQAAAVPLAHFWLVAEDLDDHPLSSAVVGQDFQLVAYVEDLRNTAPEFAGVWAAFLDVDYDRNFVSVAPSTHEPGEPDPGFEFGPYFASVFRAGDLSTPGQIAKAGAASLSFVSPGTGPELLWRITVHATGSGVATFLPSLDLTEGHESLLLGYDDGLTAEQIQFDPLQLSIVGTPSVYITPTVSHLEGSTGTTPFVFTVQLSGPSSLPVAIVVATSDGSARFENQGRDYGVVSTTMIFGPGEISRQVTVLVKGDTTIEPDETFTVNLSRPMNAVLGSRTTGIGTIVDDDSPSFQAPITQPASTPVTVPHDAIDDTPPGPDDTASRVDDHLLFPQPYGPIEPFSVDSAQPAIALLADNAPTNVAITTDQGTQQMPSVAVDPSDPNHVVIAYMDYSLLTTGYAGIAVAVSHDGGEQWQSKSIALPEGFEQGAANPIAQFDGEGHVFVSFMAATFLGPLPALTNPTGGSQRALGLQSNNGDFREP